MAQIETFNKDEMRHLAVNYAIHCMKGYDGSFEAWYDNISPDWRKIANRKESNATTEVVRDAMKAVSKDVRKPKVVRDGIVKPKSDWDS